MKTFNVDELQVDVQIDPFKYDSMDPVGVFHLKAFVPTLIDRIMEENSNEVDPYIEVIYSDGKRKKLYYKHLIFNIIMWRVFTALKLPIFISDTYIVNNPNEKTVSIVHSKMLKKCLSVHIDKRKIFGLFHETICVLNNYLHCYCWEYATGISLSQLYEIYDFKNEHGDMSEITDIQVSNPYDTKLIEIEMETRKSEFVNFIKEYYPKCCLGPYLRTETLNLNQIVQLFIAYGPRSDVDDNIVGKPILNSTLKGLRNVFELAIESLAAKKSAIYNRSSVGTASYSNRQGLLTACEIYHAIERPCGNDETLKTFISKGSRFLGKNIVVNGEVVQITEENMKSFEGKYVDMISVLHCRYSNGVCSRCMGDMFNYFIQTLHLGLAAGSEIFSVILQLILSSKHLVKTQTVEYDLDEVCQKWLIRYGNSFIFKAFQFEKGYRIAIPTESIGAFLNVKDASTLKENSFSKLPFLMVLDKDDNIVEMLNIVDEPIYPYFSKSFLSYLLNIKSEVVIHDDMYFIPLEKWNFELPVFRIINVTFDMTSYVSSVWKFMRTELQNYTDVSSALNKFADIVYKKSDANIMLVEIILRSLMVSAPNDYSFPLRRSGDPIYFGTLLNVISNRSLTPKLIFERLHIKSKNQSYFLQQPSTYVRPVPAGLYAPFFGY